MEASALRHVARVPVLTGLSPHLRLQSDERLVALVRRGHHGAFEVLLKRYQPRLLAFCRHMLASNEDAEDVLQEVFSSAYNAICADDRPINARPWLYRIARNRCLNHLRRPQDAGQESMDVFEREAGATAADTVHRREEFRQIVADVHELPETQRTALLLREIDTLSYEQIADAMETTVPSIKSLLVRARMSLAEASEARQLTCTEVRLELTQAAEGMAKASAPTRRHVRTCPRCRSFRHELRKTSHALAAVSPVGPAVAAKALLTGGSAGNGAAGGSTVAGGAALAGGGAAGVLSAAGGSVVTKAAAGLVAATLVTVGAVEVRGGGPDRETASAPAASVVQQADDRVRPPSPVAPRHSPARRPAVAHPPAPVARPAEAPAEPRFLAAPAEAQPVQEQPPSEPTGEAVAPPPEEHNRPAAESDGEEPSSQAVSPLDPGTNGGGFPGVTEPGSGSSGSSGSTGGEAPPEESPPGEGTSASGAGPGQESGSPSGG